MNSRIPPGTSAALANSFSAARLKQQAMEFLVIMAGIHGGYARTTRAPVTADVEDPAVALDMMRALWDELQRLARNEAAAAAGQSYALATLNIDFEELLEALKQRGGVSMPENAPSLTR